MRFQSVLPYFHEYLDVTRTTFLEYRASGIRENVPIRYCCTLNLNFKPFELL